MNLRPASKLFFFGGPHCGVCFWPFGMMSTTLCNRSLIKIDANLPSAREIVMAFAEVISFPQVSEFETPPMLFQAHCPVFDTFRTWALGFSPPPSPPRETHPPLNNGSPHPPHRRKKLTGNASAISRVKRSQLQGGAHGFAHSQTRAIPQRSPRARDPLTPSPPSAEAFRQQEVLSRACLFVFLQQRYMTKNDHFERPRP